MSEPQSTEVWKEKKEQPPKGGFGVTMTPEQFEALSYKMNFITEETARREVAVAKSLEELKQIEAVRTYAAFVKDITTSIQTLSTLPNTEKAVEELLNSLHKVTDTFKPNGELNFESKTLSLQTDEKTIATHKTIGLQNEYHPLPLTKEENG
jgi:hypothetical protein